MSQAALPATLGLLLFCAGVYAMLAKRSISKTALGVVLCSYAAAFLAGLLSAGTPGGVVSGDQQRRFEQLPDGVAAAGFDPCAVALDGGIGRCGGDGGVQGQLVERGERQQGLDRARRWVRLVHLTAGQHLAGIHIRHDPGRCRTLGDARRTDRLDVRIG